MLLFNMMKESKIFTMMVLLVPVSIYSIFVGFERSSNVAYFNYNVEENRKFKHGLRKYGSNTGCKDQNGDNYSENTKVEFQNSFHKFYYRCDRRVINEHAWIITKTKTYTINPKRITINSNGCLDNFGRTYPLNYNFFEEVNYTCSKIKDKYFWLIKK